MSSGEEPQISILDARLAEIDRRLHTIQTGLGNDEPPPASPADLEVPGDRRPPSEAEPLARLREVTQAQEGVLASMRELLIALERIAVPAVSEDAGTAEGPGSTRAEATAPTGAEATASGTVIVSAGPFASTEALRSFERAIESLSGVRGVEVRGFEGGDRAILEVDLS